MNETGTANYNNRFSRRNTDDRIPGRGYNVRSAPVVGRSDIDGLEDLFVSFTSYSSTKITASLVSSILSNAEQGTASDQAALFMTLIEKEPIIQAHLQTRILAVLGKKWKIDGPDKEKNNKIEKSLKSAGIKNLMRHLLDAIGYGYSGAASIWGAGGEKINEFKMVDARNWSFDLQGNPAVVNTQGSEQGLNQWHKYQFVFHKHSARSGIPCVGGLLRCLLWIYFYKHYAVKHRGRYLERYGIPFMITQITEADFINDTIRNQIKTAMAGIGADGAAVVTQGTKVDAIYPQGGSGNGDFQGWINYLDQVYTLVLLGQLATSGDAGGWSKGQAQENVRNDIIAADCENLMETITNQIVRPMEYYNWQTSAMDFHIDYEPPEDKKELATVIQIISNAGYKVKQSFIEKNLGIPIESGNTSNQNQKGKAVPSGTPDNIGLPEGETSTPPNRETSALPGVNPPPAIPLPAEGEGETVQMTDLSLKKKATLIPMADTGMVREVISRNIPADLPEDIVSELMVANSVDELKSIVQGITGRIMQNSTSETSAYDNEIIGKLNILAANTESQAGKILQQQQMVQEPSPQYQADQTPTVAKSAYMLALERIIPQLRINELMADMQYLDKLKESGDGMAVLAAETIEKEGMSRLDRIKKNLKIKGKEEKSETVSIEPARLDHLQDQLESLVPEFKQAVDALKNTPFTFADYNKAQDYLKQQIGSVSSKAAKEAILKPLLEDGLYKDAESAMKNSDKIENDYLVKVKEISPDIGAILEENPEAVKKQVETIIISHKDDIEPYQLARQYFGASRQGHGDLMGDIGRKVAKLSTMQRSAFFAYLGQMYSEYGEEYQEGMDTIDVIDKPYWETRTSEKTVQAIEKGIGEGLLDPIKKYWTNLLPEKEINYKRAQIEELTKESNDLSKQMQTDENPELQTKFADISAKIEELKVEVSEGDISAMIEAFGRQQKQGAEAVKGDTILGDILYATLQTAPAMVAGMALSSIPYVGPYMAYEMWRELSRDNTRTSMLAAGFEPETANGVSSVTAPISAALEYMTMNMLQPEMLGGGALSKTLAKSIKGSDTWMGKLAWENAQEFTQNNIEGIAANMLGDMISNDKTFGEAWKRQAPEVQDWLKETIVTAGSISLLSGFSGGADALFKFRNNRAIHEIVKDQNPELYNMAVKAEEFTADKMKDILRKEKFTEGQIDEVMSATNKNEMMSTYYQILAENERNITPERDDLLKKYDDLMQKRNALNVSLVPAIKGGNKAEVRSIVQQIVALTNQINSLDEKFDAMLPASVRAKIESKLEEKEEKDKADKKGENKSESQPLFAMSVGAEQPLDKSEIDDIIRGNEKYYNRRKEHAYQPDTPEIPERVSQEVLSRSGGDSFTSAEAVLRASIETVPERQRTEYAQFPEGQERNRAKNRIVPKIRKAEETALWNWAVSNKKVFDYQNFHKRRIEQVANGMDGGGAEHETLLNTTRDKWWKVNFTSLHLDPLEYFNRITIHNYLFGEYAPLKFEGVAKNNDGEIGIVTTQPDIDHQRGATEQEVKDYMANLGFNQETYPGSKEIYYINYKNGIRIEDTHPGNVFVLDDNPSHLAFIDPFIFLDENSKLRRLAEMEEAPDIQAEEDIVKFSPASESGSDARTNEDAKMQWAAKGVNSPYFKNYFGDWGVLSRAAESNPDIGVAEMSKLARKNNVSEVVNPDGTPRIVYHGTKARPFNVFDPLKTRQYEKSKDSVRTPIFFTTDPEFAQEYSDEYYNKGRDRNKPTQMFDVYLDIKKLWDYENPECVDEAVKVLGKNKGDVYRDKLEMGSWTLTESPEFQQYLKDYGYDGFTNFERFAKNYAVYDSAQVKSDSRSEGTFDRGNRDIRYAIAQDGIPNRFVGKPLGDVIEDLPEHALDQNALLDTSHNNITIMESAKKVFESIYGKTIRANDGSNIVIENPKYDTLRKLMQHLIFDNSSNQLDVSKATWLPVLENTLKTASVKIYDEKSKEFAYVTKYDDGNAHIVFVKPDGSFDKYETVKSAYLSTQFPYAETGRQKHYEVVWEDKNGVRRSQQTPNPTPPASLIAGSKQGEFQDNNTTKGEEVKPGSGENAKYSISLPDHIASVNQTAVAFKSGLPDLLSGVRNEIENYRRDHKGFKGVNIEAVHLGSGKEDPAATFDRDTGFILINVDRVSEDQIRGLLNHEVFWHAIVDDPSSPVGAADRKMLLQFANEFAEKAGWTRDIELVYRQKYAGLKNVQELIDSEKIALYMQSDEFASLAPDSPVMAIIHKVIRWVRQNFGMELTIEDAQRVLANAFEGYRRGEIYYSSPANAVRTAAAEKLAASGSDRAAVSILSKYYGVDEGFVKSRLGKFRQIFGEGADLADVFERGGMGYLLNKNIEPVFSIPKDAQINDEYSDALVKVTEDSKANEYFTSNASMIMDAIEGATKYASSKMGHAMVDETSISYAWVKCLNAILEGKMDESKNVETYFKSIAINAINAYYRERGTIFETAETPDGKIKIKKRKMFSLNEKINDGEGKSTEIQDTMSDPKSDFTQSIDEQTGSVTEEDAPENYEQYLDQLVADGRITEEEARIAIAYQGKLREIEEKAKNDRSLQKNKAKSIPSADLAVANDFGLKEIRRKGMKIGKKTQVQDALHKVKKALQEDRDARRKKEQSRLFTEEELKKKEEVEDAAKKSATHPDNPLPEPTEEQKESGQYKKGKVNLHGMTVAIENPAGTSRRPEWPPLKDHYGYIQRSEGKDGEPIDVFINRDNPESKNIYVVDQIDTETGKFDEHKVVFGAKTQREASNIYLRNYEKGWGGLGSIRKMSEEEFKKWINSDEPVKQRKVKTSSTQEVPSAVPIGSPEKEVRRTYEPAQDNQENISRVAERDREEETHGTPAPETEITPQVPDAPKTEEIKTEVPNVPETAPESTPPGKEQTTDVQDAQETPKTETPSIEKRKKADDIVTPKPVSGWDKRKAVRDSIKEVEEYKREALNYLATFLSSDELIDYSEAISKYVAQKFTSVNAFKEKVDNLVSKAEREFYRRTEKRTVLQETAVNEDGTESLISLTPQEWYDKYVAPGTSTTWNQLTSDEQQYFAEQLNKVRTERHYDPELDKVITTHTNEGYLETIEDAVGLNRDRTDLDRLNRYLKAEAMIAKRTRVWTTRGINDLQSRLVKAIRAAGIPLIVKGKLLSSLKNLATRFNKDNAEATLNGIMDKAYEYTDQYQARIINDRIKKILRKGIASKQVGAPIKEKLLEIRKIINMSLSQYEAEITALSDKLSGTGGFAATDADYEKYILYATFGGIRNKKAQDSLAALEAIEKIILGEKLKFQMFKEQYQQNMLFKGVPIIESMRNNADPSGVARQDMFGNIAERSQKSVVGYLDDIVGLFGSAHLSGFSAFSDTLEYVSPGSQYPSFRNPLLNHIVDLLNESDDNEIFEKEAIAKKLMVWMLEAHGINVKAMYKYKSLLDSNRQVVKNTGIRLDIMGQIEAYIDAKNQAMADLAELKADNASAEAIAEKEKELKNINDELVRLSTTTKIGIAWEKINSLRQKIEDRRNEGFDSTDIIIDAMSSKINKLESQINAMAGDEEAEIALSQNSAAYLWLSYQQPNIKRNYNLAGITDDVMDQIYNFMTEGMKKYAVTLRDKYFNDPENRRVLQTVHQNVFFTDMKFEDNYIPFIPQYTKKDSTLEEIKVEGKIPSGIGGMNVGNLISRIPHFRPPEISPHIIDLERVTWKYIDNIEHFKAAALNNKVLHDIFRDEQLRSLIMENGNAQALTVIDNILLDFARGKTTQFALVTPLLQKLYGNMFTAKIGLSVMSPFKQMIGSTIALGELDIKVLPIAFKYLATPSGWKEFARDWAKLKTNKWVQNRIDSEAIRRFVIEGHMYGGASGKGMIPLPASVKEFIKTLGEKTMFATKYADMYAIMLSGVPQYKYYECAHYNEAINNMGMDTGQAREYAEREALKDFERIARSTQSSPSLHDVGRLQKSALLIRMLFAFQNAPMQYHRRACLHLINIFRRDSGYKVKDAKGFFFYWMVLPMLEQYITSAFMYPFSGDDDDKDEWRQKRTWDMFRAALLGNLNVIPLIGDVITAVAKRISGSTYPEALRDIANTNPIAGGAESVLKIADQIVKFVEENDTEEKISNTMETPEYKKWLVPLADIVDFTTGIPVQRITKNITGVTEGLEKEYPAEIITREAAGVRLPQKEKKNAIINWPSYNVKDIQRRKVKASVDYIKKYYSEGASEADAIAADENIDDREKVVRLENLTWKLREQKIQQEKEEKK